MSFRRNFQILIWNEPNDEEYTPNWGKPQSGATWPSCYWIIAVFVRRSLSCLNSENDFRSALIFISSLFIFFDSFWECHSQLCFHQLQKTSSKVGHMQVLYWELDCLSLSALRKSDWREWISLKELRVLKKFSWDTGNFLQNCVNGVLKHCNHKITEWTEPWLSKTKKM